MAKNFTNSLRIPYQGVFSNTPIQLCGGANVVGFDFPWRQYGTYLGSNRTVAVNPGVTFTMAQPPKSILNTIQGVFIDNTNCSSPVYLECFDTKHVVACADNATAFFPLMTGGTEFTFYIESMETPWRGNQTTRILMMDTPVSPFSQQQASNRFISQAQISGLEIFSVDFLADKIFTGIVNVNSPNIIVIRPKTLGTTFIIKRLEYWATDASSVSSGGRAFLGFDFFVDASIILRGGVTVAGVTQGQAYVSPASIVGTGDVAIRVAESSEILINRSTSSFPGANTGTWILTGTEIINPTN